jgi:hypothetical protein
MFDIITLLQLTTSKYLIQELWPTLSEIANAGMQNPGLFRKVGDHGNRLDNLKPFKPQELSNAIWLMLALESIIFFYFIL